MSDIPFPAYPVPAEIDWKLRQPTQVNRSEFTSRRRATILPIAPRWTAAVKLPTIQGERNVLPWRAFFALCEGQAYSFNLVAVENVQISGVTVRVNGSGQYGSTLITDGWGAAGTKLLAGQFATVNDQLLQLVAPVVANGAGQATLNFRAMLRLTPADNALIEVAKPYAVMALADDTNGWVVGKGQQYTVGFNCEEAF
jgi:hypothetical protein